MDNCCETADGEQVSCMGVALENLRISAMEGNWGLGTSLPPVRMRVFLSFRLVILTLTYTGTQYCLTGVKAAPRRNYAQRTELSHKNDTHLGDIPRLRRTYIISNNQVNHHQNLYHRCWCSLQSLDDGLSSYP